MSEVQNILTFWNYPICFKGWFIFWVERIQYSLSSRCLSFRSSHMSHISSPSKLNVWRGSVCSWPFPGWSKKKLFVGHIHAPVGATGVFVSGCILGECGETLRIGMICSWIKHYCYYYSNSLFCAHGVHMSLCYDTFLRLLISIQTSLMP